MSKAEELITYLEGEIAKRDARIAELEAQYQRDVFGLNNEGDPIGGDPAGGYANDNARLRAELSALKAQDFDPLVCDYCNAETKDPWHGSGMLNGAESHHIHARNQCRNLLPTAKAQEPVEYQLRALIRDVTNIPEAGYYMPQSWHDQVIALSLSGKLDAPVSEAKAQGVVMPERDSFMAGVKAASDKVKAIVEDYDQRHGSTDPDTGTREYPGNGDEWVCCMLELIEDFTGIVAPSSLNAAPAAQAADEPPENCRQRLAAEGKPYPRSSCAACGKFSPKWRECDAALAAHRAKGVV